MQESTQNLYKLHKGFSLLELIIVVLLVSLMGFLVFSSAIKQEQKITVLDPTTLPSTLRESFKGQEEDIELFCIRKCKECYVIEGKSISEYDGGIDFGKDVEVYILDDDDNFVELDEQGRFKDNKICLRYHLYPNGSTTQMVIVNKEGIYYLPSYFGKAQKVEDMQEAKELWIKEAYSLTDSGSFY